MKYRIAIGADHRGFAMKAMLSAQSAIGNVAIEWSDVGTHSPDRTDYPPFARRVVEALNSGTADYGILICGSGIGVAIAANRFHGIYAGVAWNETVARVAKEDDNISLLVLPADFITTDQVFPIVRSWLSATFKEGRYAERLKMIDSY